MTIERCRGIVEHDGPRKGKRCKFKAARAGFCMFHQKYARPRKKPIPEYTTESGVKVSENTLSDRKIRVTAEANGCRAVVEGTHFQVGVIMKRILKF